MFDKNTYVFVLLALSTISGSEKLEDDKVTDANINTSIIKNTTETSQLLTQKPIQLTAIEVDDLLHGGGFKNLSHHINKQPELNSYSEETDDFKNNGKWDTELIEDGSNTEDERIKSFATAFHNSQHSEESYELVTILVISVMVILIAGYGAYYSWRRFEDRCRNRKLLVNEVDPDDMRHFSI